MASPGAWIGTKGIPVGKYVNSRLQECGFVWRGLHTIEHMQQFIQTYASGGGAPELAEKLQQQLDAPVVGGTLGFIYVTDCLAGELAYLTEMLREHTQVADWVGTVGVGLCAGDVELYDDPAVSVLIMNIPDTHYSLFRCDSKRARIHLQRPELELESVATLGLMHGNPMVQEFMELFTGCCQQLPATFFVGGLSSSNFEHPQIVGRRNDAVLSGVLLHPDVHVIVAHTQGCTPLDQRHLITQSEHNVIQEIDGRPALEVFKEDVGQVLAKDLARAGGYIYAGFPVEGSDTNDYIVRNLVGFDTTNQYIMVGDYVQNGQRLMFCRRDGNSAREDMHRMLDDLSQRLPTRPLGALYYSCLGRGRYQFGENSEELKAIARAFPDMPLAGFFANGEIYNDRLYGYTGVLTIFYSD